MKKLTYLIAFAAILISSNLQAQFELTRVGLKAGGQITNFNGDDAEKFKLDAKVGISAGFFASFKKDDLGFQPELLVSHKGANFEVTNNNFRLWYIEIPLVFKYYVHEKFNIQVGPQVGLLFYAEFAGNEVDDEFENLDIGAVAGFEYEAPQNFSIGMRYNLGFTEIGNDRTGISAFGITEKPEGTKLKNTAIQLFLGIGI